MYLDPISLAYVTAAQEPTPEVRFREEYELAKAERRSREPELVDPERRQQAALLRERVILNLGRFFARSS